MNSPLNLVQTWSRILPGCYADMDKIYELHDSENGWSSVCDIPISAALTEIVEKGKLPIHEAGRLAAELTACYSWRKNKIIYAFDSTLADELIAQADMDETAQLPIELILHPPYKCIFIQTSQIEPFVGFWAWIECDTNTKIYEFRAQFLLNDYQHTFPGFLELPAPTLGECIKATEATTKENYVKMGQPLGKLPDILPPLHPYELVLSALQLYLYLCSDKPDIEPNPEQQKIYRPRSPVSPIRDKIREIDTQDVGFRIGAVLRWKPKQEKSSDVESHSDHSERHPMRPHTRRGHWHHYWVGPKSNPKEQRLILKWTHPMLVGRSNIDEDNFEGTIYPVRKPSEEG